jgi:large subunit ribosomal protein L31
MDINKSGTRKRTCSIEENDLNRLLILRKVSASLSKGYNKMKKDLHPTVRQVVFKDVSSDFSFLGTSTMDSKETIKWEDGKSYPLIKVEISSASHPFFTGKQRVLDTGGRINRFKKKYGRK